MDVGVFPHIDRKPYCVPCYESEDRKRYMDRTEVWSPSLAAYVDAWECDECGHQVMREDAGGEVGLTNPDGERW